MVDNAEEDALRRVADAIGMNAPHLADMLLASTDGALNVGSYIERHDSEVRRAAREGWHSTLEVERALREADLQEGADADSYWTGRMEAVEIVRNMLGLSGGPDDV